MKRLLFIICMALLASTVFARPHCPAPGFHRGPGPGFHHASSMSMHPHHCHRGYWGRGGCYFWPGFVGGVLGGVVGSAIIDPAPVVVASPTVVATPAVTTPTVVTIPAVTQSVVAQPLVTVQNVWVEGRYVDQVQPNGTVVRIWQPGHYEQRQTIIQ